MAGPVIAGGQFSQNRGLKTTTITAQDTLVAGMVVDRMTGLAGTAPSSTMAIAQHSANPGDLLRVATGGEASALVGEGFNFADAGDGIHPRYSYSGTMSTTFVSVGTAGHVIPGTSAESSIGFLQGEVWCPPPGENSAPQIPFHIF